MTGVTTVLFSDLDGALLDEHTFSWKAARDTLEHLDAGLIPLIFISSKTAHEIEELRKELGNTHPYAAENGAIVCKEPGREDILGRPAAELNELAGAIAADTDVDIELLSDMTRRRAMKTTGLPAARLEAALQRTHSAPLLLHRGSPERFSAAAERRGLRILAGRRFLHLVGAHDKGDAVTILRKTHPHAVTIAIGDSESDLPMLRAVDRPIFQGQPRDDLPPGTLLECETGPVGWARAVENATQAAHLVRHGGF